MTTLGKLACAALLAASCATANAAAYIYNVNESFDGGTVTGTITTDAIGSLGAANFTDWSLSLQRGADTANLTASNSTLSLGELAPTIFATLSGLTITLADQNALVTAGAFNSSFFISNGGPTGTFFDLESDAFSPDPGDYFSMEVIRLSAGNQAFAGNNSVTFTTQSAGVPEPATLALLGISGLGFLRRRKVA